MFKSSIIYLFSSTLSKLVPFFLLPLLTSYLPPKDYAVIAIVQAFYSLCLAMLGNVQANIPNSYILDSQSRFSDKVTAMLCLLVAFFMGLELLLFAIHFFYGDFLDIDQEYYVIMPVVAVMGAINLMNLALVRVKERPIEYAVWEISHAVLNVTISLLLVVYFAIGWEGRVYGILVPITLYGLASLVFLYKSGNISLSVKVADVVDISKASVPMIPHGVGAVIIALSDNFMIATLLGKESVGLYAIGYQFGMVILMLTDAFSKAWQPMFYRYAKELQFRVVKKVQLSYLLGLPIIAFVYGVVACWVVPFVVDERYATAIQFIPVIVAAYVAMGYYQLYFPYLILYKKTKVLVYITPCAALVNVLLNYWWLPIFGAIGAAYATLIAYIITSVSLYIYTRRLIKNNEKVIK